MKLPATPTAVGGHCVQNTVKCAQYFNVSPCIFQFSNW